MLRLIKANDTVAYESQMSKRITDNKQLSFDLRFYVLLTQTLARIYSKLNRMTHEMTAEKIRWEALSDD